VGPNQRDSLKDFWSTLEQFCTAFYGKGMRRNRFFHILRFLYFNDNTNEPNKIDENYDPLWKMRAIFDKLSDVYAKCCSPREHITVD
jgi:hypothetical protein